jgi:hypothetical protein
MILTVSWVLREERDGNSQFFDSNFVLQAVTTKGSSHMAWDGYVMGFLVHDCCLLRVQ